MSQVIVVGAGPAGASLAYLLSRSGINTTLIERRQDFGREFRGEVLMPSGIDALQQMGLNSLLDSIPANPLSTVAVYMNGRLLFSEALSAAAFNNQLPLAVSQPALLEGIVGLADASPHFTFRRGATISKVIVEAGRVCGVNLRREASDDSLRADLVIGADGRNSAIRRHLNLEPQHASPPMDIVWCKVPCPEGFQGARAYLGRGHLLIAYHTWDGSLQLGWAILKGTFGELRERGIERWVNEMANHVSEDLATHLRQHSNSAARPFLLDTVSDRVTRWSAPGALLIGDAAHTMSPVAAQGVNIALRDAIVAANRLVPVLSCDAPDPVTLDNALAAIEAERLPEVTAIQNLQDQPPKVVLSRAWWGEPVRQIAGQLLKQPALRSRALPKLSAFPFGVTQVHLNV